MNHSICSAEQLASADLVLKVPKYLVSDCTAIRALRSWRAARASAALGAAADRHDGCRAGEAQQRATRLQKASCGSVERRGFPRRCCVLQG